MTTSFGRDTSCTDTYKPGRFASGARLVAESDYRRLTTRRGVLRGAEDEANFGLDLSELVGTAKTDAQLAALPAQVRDELMKDQRHDDVEVTYSITKTGPFREVNLSIKAITKEGPFTLNVLVSAVTLELLGIEEG